jgi:hypothetical protein
LPFYKMTMVLEKLSAEVAITSELLCHDKIRQHQKKDVELKDSILFSLWDRYQKNEVIKTKQIINFSYLIVFFLICSYLPWNCYKKSSARLGAEINFPSHVAENPSNVDIDVFDMSVEEEL